MPMDWKDKFADFLIPAPAAPPVSASGGLPLASAEAERYGDTAAQDALMRMRYPQSQEVWGAHTGFDYSTLPSEARQQRYRTQNNEPHQTLYVPGNSPYWNDMKKGSLKKFGGK